MLTRGLSGWQHFGLTRKIQIPIRHVLSTSPEIPALGATLADDDAHLQYEYGIVFLQEQPENGGEPAVAGRQRSGIDGLQLEPSFLCREAP